MADDPIIARLRRRLERWELPHLRQHAAELAERLERAEAEAADLRRQLADAEDRAGFWHDQAIDRLQDLPAGFSPGLAPDGRVFVIARTGDPPPA